MPTGCGPVGVGRVSWTEPGAVGAAHAWRATPSGTAAPTPAASAAAIMRRRVMCVVVVTGVMVTCPPQVSWIVFGVLSVFAEFRRELVAVDAVPSGPG